MLHRNKNKNIELHLVNKKYSPLSSKLEALLTIQLQTN